MLSIYYDDNVTLTICDYYGREVMRLIDNKPIKYGQWNYNFDLSKVQVGEYELVLTSGGTRLVQNLEILR